jgi:polyhydroxybutyrate depolymerase
MMPSIFLRVTIQRRLDGSMNRSEIAVTWLARLLTVAGAGALLAACGSSTASFPDSGAQIPQGASNTDDASSNASPDSGSAGDGSNQPTVPGTSDGGDAARDGAVSHDGGAGSYADAGTAARSSPGCSAAGDSASTGTVDISFDNTARSYILHLPAAATTGPIPLVVNLHQYEGSGAVQESLTGMDALADSDGFVVAYPNGLGSPTDWNAGSCCSAASENDRDDVGFIAAVVGDIEAHACIDLARVYVAGFSNGGMMAVRLACQRADLFAAAATVSGSAAIPLSTCQTSRPIAFMHIHGTADPLVPYDGGSGGLPISGEPTPIFPAVSEEIATLRSEDDCPTTSDTSFDQGNASCTQWASCGSGSEVVFCTINGGSHAWPTSDLPASTYAESSPFDATTQIWQFFSRHAL